MDRRPLRVAFWMLSAALLLLGALAISAPDSIRLTDASLDNAGVAEPLDHSGRQPPRVQALAWPVRGTAEPEVPRHAHVGSSELPTPTLSEILADMPDAADGAPLARSAPSKGLRNRLVAHGALYEELPPPPGGMEFASASRAIPPGVPRGDDLTTPLRNLTSEIVALREELQLATRFGSDGQREALEGLRREFQTFAETRPLDGVRTELQALAQRQQQLEESLVPNNSTAGGGQIELVPSADDPNLWTARIIDAPPGQVMQRIGEAGGWNLVVGSSIAGPVTVTLHNAKLEDVLHAVAQSLDGVVVEESGYRLLMPAVQAAARRRSTERAVAKVLRPKYVAALDVLPLIRPLLTPGVGEAAVSPPTADPATPPARAHGDVLLVLDYAEAVAEIEALLAEIDVPPVQLQIDAVITTIRTNERTKWGAVSALQSLGVCQDCCDLDGLAPGRVASARDDAVRCGQFNGSPRQLLRHLEELADLHIEATPSLRVLNRQPATLTIGQDIGYQQWQSATRRSGHVAHQVEFLPGVTHLCVQPFLWSDGVVRMQVHPQLSYVTIDRVTGVPRRDVAEIETDLAVPLGCTAVIGGLSLHAHEHALEPAARSKPWLKWPLRKAQQVTADEGVEVVILLTPRLVEECRDFPAMEPPAFSDPSPVPGDPFTTPHPLPDLPLAPVGSFVPPAPMPGETLLTVPPLDPAQAVRFEERDADESASPVTPLHLLQGMPLREPPAPIILTPVEGAWPVPPAPSGPILPAP